MIFRLVTVLMLMLPFCSTVEASGWDSIKEFFGMNEKGAPPEIKVLVIHDVDGVNFEVKGKYSLYDPYTNSHISTRFIGKSKMMQSLRSGLKWGEEFPGLYQIKIVPEDPSARIYINGVEYSGVVYVYDVGGAISIVNEVKIEQYLLSVMASEYSPSMPGEALAAFAIAQRTNAYVQAANPKNTYWAVDAQKSGYKGNDNLEEAEWATKAVQNTQYMILSNTGVYEGVATPFAIQWGVVSPGKNAGEVVVSSEISPDDAVKFAKDGMHAAQILAKVFPRATVMLMSYAGP
jgi:stage II sporulation protein D